MDSVKEYGQEVITTEKGHRIGIVTIIGEIEGHTLLAANAKTTKYEHMIPLLIGMENDASVDGILFVLNTIGGDVECGLAMAELIAAIQKPTISLVIGGSHSIGIPLAVATDCSFIVPSATMLAHPVRMSGTVLGAPIINSTRCRSGSLVSSVGMRRSKRHVWKNSCLLKIPWRRIWELFW